MRHQLLETTMRGSFRRLATVLCLGILLGICQGCVFFEGMHRYYSRTQAKEHFYRHQAEFQSLVTEWITHHPDDALVYCPWDKGEVRWNGVSILQDGSSYIVQKGAHKGLPAGSFGSAARLAGADPTDLGKWISSLKKLDIAYISVLGTKVPAQKRCVEIGLQESGANYGYLYVPSDHWEALYLIYAASQKRPDLINMERVEQMTPQWFYFEGK